MDDKQINIKSSTIEKGFELVKDLLSSIAGPAANEIGEMFGDTIRQYRYRNQLKIFKKTKEYVERKGISLKTINLKILVPLLETSSLEENEELQSKWASMIVNMADSSANLQNQIFPHILGQLSINEYKALLDFRECELSLIEHDLLKPNIEHMDVYDKALHFNITSFENYFEQTGFFSAVEDFEYSNMIRLGLIFQLPPKVIVEPFYESSSNNFLPIPRELNTIYSPNIRGYRITKLGLKFLEICEEINDIFLSILIIYNHYFIPILLSLLL